jgi:hypothetical protein
MKSNCRFIWLGMLALMLSGAAVAHGTGPYPGYGYGGLSGSATVWVNSSGHPGWAGSLTYGVGHGYAPGYIPWIGPAHGPQCHHGHSRGYERGYRHGYKHGRKHGKRRHHHHH